MAYLYYVVFLLLTQLVGSFAMVPLKCFLQDRSSPSAFGKTLFASATEESVKEQLELSKLNLNNFEINQDGLFLQLDNPKVSGLEHSIVDDIGMNMNSKTTRVTFHTDLLMTGPYKVSGSLLSIPISGEGPFKAIFKGVKVEMVIPYEIVQDESGKRFINLKAFSYSYDINEGVYQFDNLYYGNKELSDATNNFINLNWRLITFLYGKGGTDQIVEHVFNVFKRNLLSSPITDACF